MKKAIKSRQLGLPGFRLGFFCAGGRGRGGGSPTLTTSFFFPLSNRLKKEKLRSFCKANPPVLSLRKLNIENIGQAEELVLGFLILPGCVSNMKT